MSEGNGEEYGIAPSAQRLAPGAPGGGPLEWDEAAEAPEDVRRIVLFQACDEWFGLPIEAVREIQPLPRVTRVPNAPGELLGILNLRGRILALFELGRCLGIPPGTRANAHVVVLDFGDPELQVGFAVQRIAQVQSIASSAIEPPPLREGGSGGGEGTVPSSADRPPGQSPLRGGAQAPTARRFALSPAEGVFELNGRVVTLLDPARVFARSLSDWGVSVEAQGRVAG